MKLVDIKTVKGKIKLETGLHIGAGDIGMQIGGTDNPVIKHPHTGEPYIPGSSIKGKVRSLLEMRSGLMGHTKGEPLTLKNLPKEPETNGQKIDEGKKIIKIFGCSGADSEDIKKLGPTRVSFSDCPLSEGWRKKVQRFKEEGLSLYEYKTENSINRISGTAENPRFTERVPSNVEFDFSICLKIMDIDANEDLFNYLLQGLRLLECDTLGGNGSRGYGKIKLTFDDEEIEKTFKKIEPF